MEELKTISDRIRLRLKSLGYSKAHVARELKLDTPQVLSNWIGRNSVPKEYLIPLAEVLGVTVKWLQLGIDAQKTDQLRTVHARLKDKEDHFILEQYDDVFGAMGNGVMLPEQKGQITSIVATNEWAMNNIPANTGKNNLKIVTGFGSSMRPMFNSGDAILIDIGVKDVKYDHVYFFRVGSEGFIKRLQRIPSQGILVLSENPSYREWVITEDMDFEVFGAVLKVFKGEEV